VKVFESKQPLLKPFQSRRPVIWQKAPHIPLIGRQGSRQAILLDSQKVYPGLHDTFGRMWRVRILHGPNVKYIGQGREPQWYGTENWIDFFAQLEAKYADKVTLMYLESAYEGQLIEWIWETEKYDGLIINPGALAHYSYALYDALRGVDRPAIEVHVSQIYRRESFRGRLVTAGACAGVIIGLGLFGYELALLSLLKIFLKEA
jgi:3-dehydroquinate dehydratase-2